MLVDCNITMMSLPEFHSHVCPLSCCVCLLISQKACCIILETLVDNSSVSIIPVTGLAPGSLYKVHVQSLSVSGVANSKSMSFKTEREIDHQHTSHILVVLPVVFAVLITAIIIALVKNWRYVVTSYFASFICCF